MAYIKLNIDKSIDEVVEEFEDGSITISDENLKIISDSKFGHSIFKYVNDELLVDDIKLSDLTLKLDKFNYIKSVIEDELVIMAKERLVGILSDIDNADRAVFDNIILSSSVVFINDRK